jgi:hypothetical protein
LKILLSTYYLRDWTGSELFTVDLARSLTGRGHEVYLHAPFVGAIVQPLIDEGFTVAHRLPELSAVAFDVAHVHHNVVAAAVRAAFPHLPIVMMLHGVLPELEQPPSANLAIARLLCVSEEVLEHATRLDSFGAIPEVVRNFVDADYWHTSSRISPKLERVLVLSNDYPPEMRQLVEKACSLAGVDIEHVGIPENQNRDVRPAIARADLVITLGRGAIEAMAMGRNVVVLGSRGGDGFVDERSFFEFRQRNFSGRTARISFSPSALAKEMLRYDPELSQPLRNLVHAENAESKIVDRLESIYREAAGQEVVPPENTPLLREISFLYQEVCNGRDYWPPKTGSEILQGQCESLRERLRSNEAELADIHASTSWRITAPVRLIARAARGGLQPVRALPGRFLGRRP